MGEILYNGIVLPQRWPPNVTVQQLLERRPPEPPYIKRPPHVITIDVGRQLLVDDFLVLWTNATRTFHSAIPASRPVLEPLPADSMSNMSYFGASGLRSARPYSGGIFFDERSKRFVMHYRCLWNLPGQGSTCVAFSPDGLTWTRAARFGGRVRHSQHDTADWTPKTWSLGASAKDPHSDFGGRCRAPLEQSSPTACGSESATVWLDRAARRAGERWKAITRHWYHKLRPLTLWASPDGVNWQMYPDAENQSLTGPVMDKASFFYNPFRRRWVFSIRDNLCSSPTNLQRGCMHTCNGTRHARAMHEHPIRVRSALCIACLEYASNFSRAVIRPSSAGQVVPAMH